VEPSLEDCQAISFNVYPFQITPPQWEAFGLQKFIGEGDRSTWPPIFPKSTSPSFLKVVGFILLSINVFVGFVVTRDFVGFVVTRNALSIDVLASDRYFHIGSVSSI
jgi:hypothetical protein